MGDDVLARNGLDFQARALPQSARAYYDGSAEPHASGPVAAWHEHLQEATSRMCDRFEGQSLGAVSAPRILQELRPQSGQAPLSEAETLQADLFEKVLSGSLAVGGLAHRARHLYSLTGHSCSEALGYGRLRLSMCRMFSAKWSL